MTNSKDREKNRVESGTLYLVGTPIGNMSDISERAVRVLCEVDFVAAEDTLVDPAHSKRLAEGLKRAGIPCMIEIGPTGGHGFTDGTGMCMEGWPARALKWLETL